MDVGWNYLVSQTPVMANPFEYRQRLWAILHGDDTPPKPQPTTPSKNGRKALPPAPRVNRRPPSKSEWDALAAHQARIDEIKAKREAENAGSGNLSS